MRTRTRFTTFGALVSALLALALMGAGTAAAQETTGTTGDPTTTEETTSTPTTRTARSTAAERRRILATIRRLRRETWRSLGTIPIAAHSTRRSDREAWSSRTSTKGMNLPTPSRCSRTEGSWLAGGRGS